MVLVEGAGNVASATPTAIYAVSRADAERHAAQN